MEGGGVLRWERLAGVEGVGARRRAGQEGGRGEGAWAWTGRADNDGWHRSEWSVKSNKLLFLVAGRCPLTTPPKSVGTSPKTISRRGRFAGFCVC